jgi:hypothetical protein
MKILAYGLTILLILSFVVGCTAAAPLPTPSPAPTPTLAPTTEPTSTPQPLLPTPLVVKTVTPVPTRALTVTLTPAPTAALLADRWRFGVALAVGQITDYDLATLLPGWYLNWNVTQVRPETPEIEYAPMVRVSETGFSPSAEAILAVVDAMPGALWMLGNEPDVRWQDNTTPEAYARHYHALYTLIKGRDPSAQVAIGGLSQPTALRIRYLERVLATYEAEFGAPMPVDVWNIHAFILREEADSWGVGIPPGFDDKQGELYEIKDNDNLEIFQRQIIGFRYWLWTKGQRDKPLIVSEYAVNMPPDYGFPPEAVQKFMEGSFDFLLNARDPEIGYPQDDNRLVQRWCWYSLADPTYFTSNLFDPQSYAITPLGEAFGRYVRTH